MKKRSQYPWNNLDTMGHSASVIYDTAYRFVANCCWNAPDGVTRKHTPKAHEFCISRAEKIVEAVNAAQERKP